MFYLKNREFAMTFDVSHAECGMNGAMYFIEMDAKGGKGRGNNQAGAKYGTGYCDAQCPHDIKFIDGEANYRGWKPNPKDTSKNMGTGHYGSCCAEMDIWEANSMATAYTPHPCTIEGQLKCEGADCGDNDKGERYKGVCDKDGCDINPFRMGNKSFYGKGKMVDTTKPVTTVTQFLTTDGTDQGDLSEIRRYYVQDGQVIPSPRTVILGDDTQTDSIDDEFCRVKKELFDDVNDYAAKGGDKEMGKSLDRGQVLAVSLWDDVEVNMLWLDSAFPLDKPVDKPGILRGECPGGQKSTPEYVRKQFPDGYVSFQSAYVGPIGSFLKNPPSPSPPGGGGGGGACGCGPAKGQNQPECKGVSEERCKHIIQYENKCSWTDCPVPTPSPPNPTPAPPKPTPVPTNPPTPEPSQPCPTPAPKVGCERFCDMQDLVKGGKKNCKFMKKMGTLCEMSYLTKGDKVVQCEMDPKKKKCVDGKKLEECDIEKVCAQSLSETGHSEDEDHESEEEDDDEADDEDPKESLAAKAKPERKKGFLQNSSAPVYP